MLTALGSREDRIVGLEAGADDYVVKPFDVQEVVLRVRALARRISERDRARKPSPPPRQLLRSGTLTVDPVTHEVRGDGTAALAAPARVQAARDADRPSRAACSRREELLEQVWEIEHGSERTVDVHVRRLRLNLGASGRSDRDRSGFGYRAKR